MGDAPDLPGNVGSVAVVVASHTTLDAPLVVSADGSGAHGLSLTRFVLQANALS